MAQLTIGTVQLDGRFIMAPMAGVTDRAFRQICREHGAALTVSEMISTKALHGGHHVCEYRRLSDDYCSGGG